MLKKINYYFDGEKSLEFILDNLIYESYKENVNID